MMCVHRIRRAIAASSSADPNPTRPNKRATKHTTPARPKAPTARNISLAKTTRPRALTAKAQATLRARAGRMRRKEARTRVPRDARRLSKCRRCSTQKCARLVCFCWIRGLFLFLVSLLWLAPLNPARAMVCVRVRVSVHCRHRLKRMESICTVQGIRERAQALFKEKEAASTKPPAAAAAQ